LETDKNTVYNIDWDYFKLLAQQRVTHFNLFIVIVLAIVTIYSSQIGNSVYGNLMSAILAVTQIALSFVFYKIDLRNKFLIKHTESIMMKIENDLDENIPKIFVEEMNKTNIVRENEKKKSPLLKQLSTSQLYRFFFFFFIVVGVFEIVISAFAIIYMVSTQ